MRGAHAFVFGPLRSRTMKARNGLIWKAGMGLQAPSGVAGATTLSHALITCGCWPAAMPTSARSCDTSMMAPSSVGAPAAVVKVKLKPKLLFVI